MKPVILVDIDGTIALRGNRSPHDHEQAMEDHVNWPIVSIIDSVMAVDEMGDNNLGLILISGREEKYRDITEYWLRTHELFSYRLALLMRATNDNRPDDVVKEELYTRFIAPHYTVTYVFDDRNKVVAMWRANGLTCLQVADGNF